MKRNWCVTVACCCFTAAVLAFPRLARADVEGRPCIPEPTDEHIEYGDLITCDIGPVGQDESDIFRFEGVAGETAIILATDLSGAAGPEACVRVYRPDLSLFRDWVCSEESAAVYAALDQTGEWSLLVADQSHNEPMMYVLVLERATPPSPSATSMDPGDVILDQEINPKGDIDVYFFEGAEGDQARLTLTDRSGGAGPEVCIQLYRPDGTTVYSPPSGWLCGEASVFVDLPLDQSGEWSFLVADQASNETMTFDVEYVCVGGGCQLAKRPTCEVQMSQPTYTDGDTVTAEVFRLANPSADPVPIELKTWFVAPGEPDPFGHGNAGADGSAILPPGFDHDYGPIDLYTVKPGHPRGTYEYNCRLLVPASGRTLTLDVNQFQIIP